MKIKIIDIGSNDAYYPYVNKIIGTTGIIKNNYVDSNIWISGEVVLDNVIHFPYSG